MPCPEPGITTAEAAAFIRDACHAPTGSAGLVGIETEWFVVPRAADGPRASHDAVRDVVEGALPGGSRITWEPGGQLELSTAPLDGPGAACAALATDLAAVRTRLAAIDHTLLGTGMHPAREPVRVVDRPRYRAMEAFFDAAGPHGRRMMCTTASIQVNLDAGANPAARAQRWRRAHLFAPVLAAACASSPIWRGRPTGWRSTRLATWGALDATRTAPVAGEDPDDAWPEYALAAHVMFIRRDAHTCVPLPEQLSLSAWIRDGHPLGYPTTDDITEHLTTLFPPVRPRGWLELRVPDALPDPWWRVPVAISAAALDGDVVDEACPPIADDWEAAARHGLAHPGIARAARAVFTDALARMESRETDPVTAVTVAEFIDRYVARGRTPADDALDALREPTWTR
jgi:glutamate--cysteine ligase